jgi:hypothetical protein
LGMPDDIDFHEAMNGAGIEPSGWDEPEVPSHKINGVETKLAVDLYNAMADKIGLSRVAKLTDARAKKLKKRLIDCGGIDGWTAALAKVETLSGLQGKNDRGWKANLDFLCQESSFTKLMEGYYDNWNGKGSSAPTDAELENAISSGFRSGGMEAGLSSPRESEQSGETSTRARNRGR